MEHEQLKLLDLIRNLKEKLSHYEIEYWQNFSDLTTWQFWVTVLMIILPLIILFIYIDKSKMLLLGFFGLNYHVWFAYINVIGIGLGLFEYPYHFIPIIPSFSLDAALIPVCFMLLYQWTLNRNKNIYLYSILLSALFAFILKPLMVNFHFFHMHKGINYVHLFLFFISLFIVSKLITDFFVWMQKRR